MSGLAREVLKWLQSLDLTWQIKTPKWDLTNGYLVAEIFSWYYPQEIQMHMYNNGTSLDSKQRNWALLKNFVDRHKFNMPEEFVEGTIHCKEGAATLLVERIYEVLTNRQIRKVPNEIETDFTDFAYQVQLPMHARSTASQAVKNNLRSTELVADSSIILGQQKAQTIIHNHIEHRRAERYINPERFDKKPTLGERAPRVAPPPSRPSTYATEVSDYEPQRSPKSKPKAIKAVDPKQKNSAPIASGSTVQFKEISVKQLDRTNQFRPTVTGC